MNCGCRTVLALSTPPTSIMRKQQMAKFLKRKTLRLMRGSFCRHSHQTSAIMPPTNRKAKKRMKLEENQSFSSPLSSMILHAAHGDGEEGEADVIHVAQAGPVCLDPRRIFNQAGDEEEGENADGMLM